MQENRSTKILVGLSAAMSVLAGIIHFWLVPVHWSHAPAHGIFFAIIGVVQVLWANEVWRRPGTRLYYIGAIISGWLIVLYALTRWFPAPFGHGPEAVDVVGIACKACELLAMIPPMILIFQGLLLTDGRKVAWETTALIVVFSVLAAISTYTVARAAEPYLPALASPASFHEHDDGAPSEHHHDEPPVGTSVP